MAIRKQNITGKTPTEIADMLQTYGDVVSTQFKNISSILLALNRDPKSEFKIIMLVKGDRVIIGTEEIKD